MCGGQCGGAEFGEELNEKHVVAVKSLFLWFGGPFKGAGASESRIEAIRFDV